MFYATGRARLAAQVAGPESLYRSHSREGFVPRLVDGRPVKAWNQWYNKRMKELKKQLPKEERERVTKQMERITNTRNRRIHHYLALFLGTIVEEKVSADDGEYARWEWTDAHPGGGGRAAPGIPAASRPAGGAPHG